LNGLFNFLDAIEYFDQIFNPTNFLLNYAQQKNLTFITYADYIKIMDNNKSKISLNITTLLDDIIDKKNPPENINKIKDHLSEQLNNLNQIKSKIIGDITNFAILSIFLIISSILTFALRNYTGDWRKDMNIYFIVIFF
jgi:uncharacterized protein (UPF0147 family)